MNTIAPLELKVVVERVVRPLLVSQSRKRQMREELLNHLVGIYDEEVETHGHTRVALERAKQRFGDPAELSNDLRQTVPRSDHARRLVEKLRYHPEEPVLHFAGKHLLGLGIECLTAIALVLPIVLYKGRMAEIGTVARILIIANALIVIFAAGFLFLVDRISRALHGTATERSRRTAVLYCFAALFALPLMSLTTSAALAQTFPSHGQALLTMLLAPVIPAVLVLISRQAAEEIRAYEEWEQLDLSESPDITI